ncbi:MAG: ABC transporter permease [Polyangiaceae bacterium]|nr:ABC transporter permease [Polyangiaceae bacterium]
MRGVLEGIVSAVRSIVRNPLRASLTVLGILIAVSAVVTVDAIGTGGRARVSAQIDAIGSNFIVIFPQTSQSSGARGAQGAGMRLTEDDGRAILRESTSVAAVAPALRASVQIVFGDRNWSTQAFGTRLAYLQVRNWPVERGAAWEPHDEATKAKVVLIGRTVAQTLFGGQDPINQMVRIGRYPYRVLGVLAPKGDSPFGADQDDIVLMPSTSFRARVQRVPPNFAGALLASATSSETTDRAVRQINAILRQRHRIEEGRDPDFAVRTQKEFAEMKDRIANALSLLLIFVAAVSLVAGGIGVMNIMLVSVTERTREIGIRMAIGARAADIRTQFLVEAVALTFIGGVAGVVVGAGVVQVLGAISGWPMALRWPAIFVSLAVSAGTGVTFGFFPARRAAMLDPMEALRHE